MITPRTEALHDLAKGLDARPLAEVTAVLVDAQIAAASTVSAVAPVMAKAAAAMAQTIRADGVLHYVAAGSSGLMAAADAQELGGTFSIPPEQLRIHMAGGLPRGVELPGATEDDTAGLHDALASLDPRDTVIAVSASGTTPFTLAAAEIARSAGATLIAIANNPGSTLLALADHPICLATPPEIPSGSTRMGAGTAQKIAVNTLSTAMAVELGHVHDGMMVNLRADNTKLRARALAIVCTAAGVGQRSAAEALDAAQGNVKLATLIAAREISADRARTRLREANGNLRAALAHHSDDRKRQGGQQ